MLRWLLVVLLALVGFAIVADWVVFALEVRANPPSTFYAGEFLLRCAVSAVYAAVLVRGGRRR